MLDRVAATGLLRAGEPVTVLLSGGRDSVCLLDVAVALRARVRALHVNYGLRDEAAGDEVMIVGSDPAALVDWAVGFQELYVERPLPRIGMHFGETVYRDGDYYGRAVNLAARVAARAAGREVVVTRTVVESAGSHLEFDLIGEVRLKGFNEPTELFLARAADDG